MESTAAQTLAVYNDSSGDGLYATGSNNGRAVVGVAGYQAIHGTSFYSNAVQGHIWTADNPFNAIYGLCESDVGNGVFGEVHNAGGAGSGVLGINNGKGAAIAGLHRGSGSAFVGDSVRGRGAEFSGKKAQARLKPSDASTHPASGKTGDLFVDSNGRLWFCKGGSVWAQLA